ncbi:MAG: hypothetical protein ACQEVA_19710 [Myxococcota bacterium]
MTKIQLKRACITACLSLVALAFAGCSNDMNAGQYTFACDEENPCTEGFFCGPDGVCVEDGTDVSSPEDGSDTTDVADAGDTEQGEDTSDVADTSDAPDTVDTSDTQDGEDSDDACEPQTWYRDCDDDGYAGMTTEACERPQTGAGDCPIDGEDVEQRWKSASEIASTTGEDCDDNDVRAFPGQTAYFASERAEAGGFDFNCDTTETIQWDAIGGSCEESGLVDGCGLNSDVRCELPSSDEGWDTQDPPECGVTRTWLTDCQSGCHDSCDGKAIGQSRSQACR